MSSGQWKPKRPRRPGADRAWFRGFNLALSFGVTLAVSLWITWHAGQWLDNRLGTGFVITMVFIIIGIISSFRVFLKELEHFDEVTEKRDD